MSSPFGLDFGNDNSVYAVAKNRGIDIVVNDVSNRATPSVVGFGMKNRFIGEAGKTKESSNIKNTVANLKRIIGLNYDDPDFKQESQYFQSKLVKLEDGKVGAQLRFKGEQKTFSAVQLAAMYFGKSKQIVEADTKLKIHDVAVAVPAWYNQEQRYAVVDAAKIAGLNPVRIITDVTCAGISYGIFKQDLPEGEEPAKIVAFVDIGHSTYTCSIAAFKKGEMKILGTGVDKHFGGRDFDKAITEHFVDEFNAKYKVDARSNPKAYYRILTAAQKLKKVLSANSAAPFNVESVMNDHDFSSQLTREQLEELVAPLLKRINGPIDAALEQAGVSIDQVHSIELLGGSTRIPCLKDFISTNYKEVSRTLNSEECISKGAAFICASANPLVRVRPFKYTDVVSDTIAINFGENEFEPVFEKASPYPSTKLVTLTKDADFSIEAKTTSNNETIAKFDITGVPKESTDLKIKVRVDPSGFVTVQEVFYETVEEINEEDVDEEGETITKTSTKTHQHNLTVTGGSPYEIPADKLAELTAYELELTSADSLVKQTEDAKNHLEETIYYVKDKISSEEWKDFASEAEISKLDKLVNSAEEWLYSDDGEDAKKAKYVAKYEEIASVSNLLAGRKRQAEQEKVQARKAKQEAEQMAKLAEKLQANRKEQKKEEPTEDVQMD
ncbi:hypothetical protein ACO0QE_002466 [Hanseniaspora vineae]